MGRQNEIWAKKLIDALIDLGIDYFCCAPGSRSTPLALAIANSPRAKSIVHFDERGLCFHAVGYGKAVQTPAVIIVTSGTAVGNLLPAIMEASNERIPLILLTADRPPELRDCGANQTIDQVKLFTNFVRWQVDLPCPEDCLSDRYLASVISQAVLMTSYPPAGPVHINCMFREPLFSTPLQMQFENPAVQIALPKQHASEKTIDEWVEKLSSVKRGVILVGSSSLKLSEALFTLAERLKWPVFADILSTLRSPPDETTLIAHFDPILKLRRDIEVDAVVQFGNRFVSKTLSQWITEQKLKFYVHISEQPVRQDPLHLATHRIIADPQSFSARLCDNLEPVPASDWLDQWKKWNDICKEKLEEFFSDDSLSEPRIIWEIASRLKSNWNLFLANSMPVRDANQFANGFQGEIFGNRGVSGIDGNIATACGLSAGNQKPTLAVIGDLTFLHDLTSLAMLAKSSHPVVICAINNSGGGIFSFLPISKRQEAVEKFIIAAHETHFASAAKLFDLPYFHPKTSKEWIDLLKIQEKNPHSCIIEITTNRIDNVYIHEQIITSIAPCLNSANSLSEIPATLH